MVRKILENLMPIAIGAATNIGITGLMFGTSHLPPHITEGVYFAGLAHGNGYNDSERPYQDIANPRPMNLDDTLEVAKFSLPIGFMVGLLSASRMIREERPFISPFD